MKTVWVNTYAGTPGHCDQFKDRLDCLLFVVHTAPVVRGEVHD